MTPQIACIKSAIIHNPPLCVHYLPQKVCAVESKLEIIQLIPATDLNKTPYKIIKKYEHSCIVNRALSIENKPLLWSCKTCILLPLWISLWKRLINHIVMRLITNCFNYVLHRVNLFKLLFLRLDILLWICIIHIKQYRQVPSDIRYVVITTNEYLYFWLCCMDFYSDMLLG